MIFLIGFGSTYLNKYFDDFSISNAQKFKCAEKASQAVNGAPCRWFYVMFGSVNCVWEILYTDVCLIIQFCNYVGNLNVGIPYVISNQYISLKVIYDLP